MSYANLQKQPYPTEAHAIRVSPIEETMNRLDNSITVLMETAQSLSSSLALVTIHKSNYGEERTSSVAPIKPVTCLMDDQLSAFVYRMDDANKFLSELKARIQL